ncbi:MAG: UDP-2,3-diacylglucosamine diphosphatase LpxI [Planctomycetota bacterium]|nr:UDP-2,3-diacylglucosamine diphosphatase LpxI [Planctomycetota bacterium]
MSKKVGLIAGWGRYPILIAEKLVASGCEVYCLAIKGHADQKLRQLCADYREVGVARVGSHIRFFKKHGVRHATMAGKVFKTLLFEKGAFWKHLPDLTFWRYFSSQFLLKSADRKDDTLLGTYTVAFQKHGIELGPATDYAPDLLVKKKSLGKRNLNRSEMKDVEFGWMLAKQMGALDVGQSVAVKTQAVLAVEAVEGTDECIRRAGQLCPSGGFTVVKVAKPQQDMRFDVPTIGLGTLQTMKQTGATVLAVEADRTIIIDEPEVIRFADRNRIKILVVDDEEIRTGLNLSSEQAA